jgi:hypothetical protein
VNHWFNVYCCTNLCFKKNWLQFPFYYICIKKIDYTFKSIYLRWHDDHDTAISRTTTKKKKILSWLKTVIKKNRGAYNRLCHKKKVGKWNHWLLLKSWNMHISLIDGTRAHVFFSVSQHVAFFINKKSGTKNWNLH